MIAPVPPPPVAPAPVVAHIAQAAPRPSIVGDFVPFGSTRIAETRSYARRHYGLDRARLLDPQVIVIHFTGSDSYASAHATFAQDTPDVELHELPGVCAHFIVDRDGTIRQQVSLRWICRHTVGLNWTAIGIEHVGTSDAEVLGDARQLRASLALVRFLQRRDSISTANVIGHAESLTSPLHRERVAQLRTQTHGDFRRSSMDRYRAQL